MAEINNVIAEASQDLQTIEDFVNLPAGSDVRPRLLPSVNVGTLAGTRDAIFEAGGLPATPFATKALMTASPLVDGDYAVVTNDIPNHNGLYYKKGSEWEKTSFLDHSSVERTNRILDYLISSQTGDELEQYTQDGFSVNTSSATGVLFPDTQNLGLGYVQVYVEFHKSFEVSESISDPSKQDIPEWRWVFADSDFNRITSSPDYGDGIYLVPEGAVYAFRTYKHTTKGFYDSSMVIKGVERTVDSIPDIKDQFLAEIQNTNSLIFSEIRNTNSLIGSKVDLTGYLQVIDGASAKTNAKNGIDTPLNYSSHLTLKSYMLDVSELQQFEVVASNNIAGWLWVFADKDGIVVAKSLGYGDGVYQVPEGATHAYRTFFYAEVDLYESPDMKIFGAFRTKDKTIYELIDEASNNTASLVDSMESMFESGDVLKLSEFNGASSDDKLREAIKFVKIQGYGIIDLETGEHVINSSLLLPSNCWLYLNNSTLKLADGVFDNIIRNDGIVVNEFAEPPVIIPNGDLAVEINENTNIRVFGNGAEHSVISGNEVPYIAVRPDQPELGEVSWDGDDFGWRTVGILFCNVKNYKMYGFKLINQKCWAISQENGCENFEVHDIEIQSAGVKNGDGVDVRMGCKNGSIYNISGYTGDDMVACTAIQNYQNVYPGSGNIYSAQVGGYKPLEGIGGDISHIKIDNIIGGSEFQGVRVLASGGSKVSYISINNVSDESTSNFFLSSVVRVSSGFGATAAMGDIKNITIKGVTSKSNREAVLLLNNIQDSYVMDVTHERTPSNAVVSDGANLNNVTIVP